MSQTVVVQGMGGLSGLTETFFLCRVAVCRSAPASQGSPNRVSQERGRGWLDCRKILG